MKELVSDIVKKGQEIDRLIEALPGISRTEEEQVNRSGEFGINTNETVLIFLFLQIEHLSALEEENAKANREYQQTVAETGKFAIAGF
jgi:hypothetical protein